MTQEMRNVPEIKMDAPKGPGCLIGPAHQLTFGRKPVRATGTKQEKIMRGFRHAVLGLIVEGMTRDHAPLFSAKTTNKTTKQV